MPVRKHGLSDSVEHKAWMRLRQRCEKPHSPDYADYGGRGITVCERWTGEHGFANFLSDMGQRPPDKTSIDRIDVNGPYSPENCRWADWRTQMRNKRSNRWLTFNGETLCLMDWAKRMGIPQARLTSRLNRDGWSVERALTQPLSRSRKCL
jgi:hypothetical protein